VSQIVETLKLIRSVNCLLAAVGVWIGAYLTWFHPVYFGPIVAGLAAFLVCAAGNVVNDLCDVGIDRISHPNRVLVRGGLSVQFARNLAIGLNAAAVILAVAVSWQVTAVAVFTIALLLAYNLRLKRTPLAGNATVALLAGLTFMTGGIAVDPVSAFRLPGPLIPCTFAFFFHLVREIIKDIQDIEGDRGHGINTLPQAVGVSRSLQLALLLFLVLVLLTLVPIARGWFGRSYEILTVYVVDLPLLALLIFLWGFPNRRMLAVTSTALKLGMAIGLLALLDL